MVWLCKTKIRRKSKIVLYGYSFIAYIKIDDIYKDIAENELDRPLPIGKNKIIIGLLKDEWTEQSGQNILDYKQKLIVT